jgi:hypothetical protein
LEQPHGFAASMVSVRGHEVLCGYWCVCIEHGECESS